MECVICARRERREIHEGSVGGYVYEDAHWYAYHAPVERAVLGQLFLVSRRHYLDFTQMTIAEASSYGQVLGRLSAALSRVVEAVRGSNSETGGRLLEFGGTEYMVRGRGYARSISDFENTVLTASENGKRAAAGRVQPTHCKRGHEFTEANTMWKQGGPRSPGPVRRCRACHYAYGRAYRARRKEHRHG